MSKIALIVPRYDLLRLGHNIQQEKDYGIEMYVASTDEVVALARTLVDDGVTIIISRGLQASRIRRELKVPLVDIVVTAQEMALMVTKARQFIKKPNPVIAVVGFKNMYCDMSYFDTLYDITLKTYFADQGTDYKDQVLEAISDKPDVIIGGDTAITLADEAHIPSLFITTTEDSLRSAFEMAKRVDYAMNVEKKNAAQMEAILDYSYNGIVQADDTGKITAVNFFMKDILQAEEKDLVGKQLLSVFTDVTDSVLQKVLQEGKEQTIFMKIGNASFFTVIAPVLVGTKTDGILMTCHKMAEKTRVRKDQQNRNEEETGLLIATKSFDDFIQNSPSVQKLIRNAKLYSLSEKPIIIYGEIGTEQRTLTQAIHNNSLRSDKPYMQVICSCMNEAQQDSMIFGEKGAAVLTDKGTLVLVDIEALYPLMQRRLCALIRHGECYLDDGKILRGIRPRIIAITQKTQEELQSGKYISDYLYHLLTGLDLYVPPLRRRPEDLKSVLERHIRESCERYKRYHVLTAGAWSVLLKFDWRGNEIQIGNFCERLILTAEKRSLDEIAVNKLLRMLYPAVLEDDADHAEGSGPHLPQPQEAQKIRRALVNNCGSREKTAEELEISKATLWRKMKKYEIE